MRRHPYDRVIEIGGKTYLLRFSLRSLALMELYLGVKGPLGLAKFLKEAPFGEIRGVSETLLRCFLLEADMPVPSDKDLMTAMTMMPEMIEEAFHEVPN